MDKTQWIFIENIPLPVSERNLARQTKVHIWLVTHYKWQDLIIVNVSRMVHQQNKRSGIV